MGNAERRQMMWNAIELVENSGIAWGVRNTFCDYVAGTVRYQARTGDKGVNQLYQDFMKERSKKALDYSGRFTLRTQAKLQVSGMLIKGDCGCNIVREGNAIYTQGIEADRIGNPYDYSAREDYIGGIHINKRGGMAGADIFRRLRMSGTYAYESTLPAYNDFGLQTFLLAANPQTFDDIRGRTVFARTLDNVHYLNEMRRFELQALMWAASQSGVFHTKSGGLPEMEFQNTGEQDQFGNKIEKFGVQPNTIRALGIGEDVSMFQHDRPSPNVIAMYRDTIIEIAQGVGLSFGMVWDMTGIQGPGVRAASNKDKRSIGQWQLVLTECFLDPVADWLLRDGIRTGEIPYHPKFNQGAWIFPPHPTIDVGRESAAKLSEYNAAVTTGQIICEEDGHTIEESQAQCGHETENLMEISMDIAKRRKVDWREVYAMLKPGNRIIMSPEFEAARVANMGNLSDAEREKLQAEARQRSAQGDLYDAQATATGGEATATVSPDATSDGADIY